MQGQKKQRSARCILTFATKGIEPKSSWTDGESLFPVASVAQCRPSAPLHCSSRHELVPAVCAGSGLPARHEAKGPHPPGPQASKVRPRLPQGSQGKTENGLFFFVRLQRAP